MTNRKIDIRHFVFLLTADCADITDFEVARLYRRVRYALSWSKLESSRTRRLGKIFSAKDAPTLYKGHPPQPAFAIDNNRYILL